MRKKLTVLLMTVMIVMVASPLFGAHEVLAAVFTGTPGNDTLMMTTAKASLLRTLMVLVVLATALGVLAVLARAGPQTPH